MMKVLIGAIVAFIVGAGCRFFDIPVPSPPAVPGALLVIAMTLGYTLTDRTLNRTTHIATTKHLCGGPSGAVTHEICDRHHDVATASLIEVWIDQAERWPLFLAEILSGQGRERGLQ